MPFPTRRSFRESAIADKVMTNDRPDYVPTIDAKAPAAALDERIRERYGIMR